MNDKRLRIYLDDHLAILVGELELARRSRSSNKGTPLGDFLSRLANEVQAQHSILADVLARIRGSESNVKKGAAWVAEKLGRFKLNDSWVRYSPLSRLIELEALASAAQARIAVWDNLETVAEHDSRLKGITFSFFREQSRQHLAELNTRRRYAAVEAFASS